MEYYASDWQRHIMGPSSGQGAFVQFEDEQHEIAAIDGALRTLVRAQMLPHSNYDHQAYSKFCASVESNFDIPWTGISPRMRRMIYAINAIRRPPSVVCAGIFCGYTFICNAGASIGEGACYRSDHLVGIEILEKEAVRAAKNLERFATDAGKNVVCAEAADWLATKCRIKIDLLYIDAKAIEFDPALQPRTPIAPQSEYAKIIQASIPHLNPGALVLAHNSVNASNAIQDFLQLVRSNRFRASMNLIIDDAGLEVSIY
jgi:hypothetical protein